MDRGWSITIGVPSRDLPVADAILRALPFGAEGWLRDGSVTLRSDVHEADRLRRIWKAALATERAVVSGAEYRHRTMRALVE